MNGIRRLTELQSKNDNQSTSKGRFNKSNKLQFEKLMQYLFDMCGLRKGKLLLLFKSSVFTVVRLLLEQTHGRITNN